MEGNKNGIGDPKKAAWIPIAAGAARARKPLRSCVCCSIMPSDSVDSKQQRNPTSPSRSMVLVRIAIVDFIAMSRRFFVVDRFRFRFCVAEEHQTFPIVTHA